MVFAYGRNFPTLRAAFVKVAGVKWPYKGDEIVFPCLPAEVLLADQNAGENQQQPTDNSFRHSGKY